MSATAIPAYARPSDGAGRPLAQSYVFGQGKFFGGTWADRGLAQLSFDQLTKLLAPGLAKQNYFPTRDAAAADLLLMVHWGVTQAFRDPMGEVNVERLNSAADEYRTAAAANNGAADPGALNALLADQSGAGQSAQQAIARNAALLGYTPTLQQAQRRIFVSAEEQTMNEELNEERYFIVVLAYDYAFMRKEHRSRLLWATRISLRSVGNRFEVAAAALAQAGAGVYGRNIDGLVRLDYSDRSGRVDLGELKVLGEAETTPASVPATR
ncbi:hypothetical protein [Opitutus terrae]|uniref:hypothetical protein n=1 Tax=Opitutus terrae TaxID=107709 RepID=UPI000317C976|nr:hypothetical protein [Opitutus terrae]